MTYSSFAICALPKTAWEPHTDFIGINISEYVKDALAIEQRIAKGVNLENERNRYTLICSKIEGELNNATFAEIVDVGEMRNVINQNKIPTLRVGQSYIEFLDTFQKENREESRSLRAGCTFYPPEMLETYLDKFAKKIEDLGFTNDDDINKRKGFIIQAISHQCGIIELQDPFSFNPEANREPGRQNGIHGLEVLREKHNQSTIEESYIDEPNLYEILRREINRAIELSRTGGVGEVNFSNQPHNVITEVLHEFVYVPGEDYQDPVEIKVIYNDGSQGPNFPLQCIPRRRKTIEDSFDKAPQLRISLMSMRHLDMDRDVDVAWLRNRDVSKSRSLGDIDYYCFNQSGKQFAEIDEYENLKILLFHTGFQPAVIGFYRAFVYSLLEKQVSSPRIVVVPKYYLRKQGYKPGKPWL